MKQKPDFRGLAGRFCDWLWCELGEKMESPKLDARLDAGLGYPSNSYFS